MDFLSVQFFFYVLHLSLYIIDGNTFYCPIFWNTNVWSFKIWDCYAYNCTFENQNFRLIRLLIMKNNLLFVTFFSIRTIINFTYHLMIILQPFYVPNLIQVIVWNYLSNYYIKASYFHTLFCIRALIMVLALMHEIHSWFCKFAVHF